MGQEKFFHADHISAGYGDRLILKDVSFALEKHTLTAIVGSNGSGKTTLLRSIANQLSHTGNCYLQGECLEKMNTRCLAQNVSYIPQKSGISISLPSIEVVLMGFNPVLRLLEQPSKKHRALAKEAMECVGLAGMEEKDFLTLSEGQKQLVFLARTMIEETALLLLDEPDSALDFSNRHLILKRLKEMVGKSDQAGLLSMHDPALALEFCDQLILIRNGTCIGIIRPKEDTIEEMENLLREIYGSISLVTCEDKWKRKHFTLLWEDV